MFEEQIAEMVIKTACNFYNRKRFDTSLKEKNKILNVINNTFTDEVKAFVFCDHFPSIVDLGVYPLDDNQKILTHNFRELISRDSKPNDPHALLVETPLWHANHLNFDIKTIDFAGILALREEGLKPKILSANAILICPDTEELLVHVRSNKSDTYPSKIHIFGGAYMPTTQNNVAPDRGGFKSTLVREILEETQLSITFGGKVPLLITEELETGFIQVNFLGVCIDEEMLEDLDSNWEGTIQRISFSQINDFLADKGISIVPSGRAMILSWLALGAPGTKFRQRFGNYSAKDIFKLATA